MGRSPACPPEEKLRIVLDLLAGRTTLKQAAANAGVSTTAIGSWKRQFLRAACEGLVADPATVDADDLVRLRTENSRLAERVRDAAVLAEVWRMSARTHYGND